VREITHPTSCGQGAIRSAIDSRGSVAQVHRGVNRLCHLCHVFDIGELPVIHQAKGGFRQHKTCSADGRQQRGYDAALSRSQRRAKEFGQHLAVGFFERRGKRAADVGGGVDLVAGACGRTDKAIADLADRGEMQVRMRFGRIQDCEIQRATHQVSTHLGRVVRLDIQRHLRQVAFDPRHEFADMPGREVILDAKAQRDRGIARRGHRALRLGPVGAQHPRMGFEPQPLGGQFGARAGPHEQPRADGLFQRHDAGRNGRLRDTQPFGGAVEAAGFDKVQKGFQKFDLHGVPLSNRFFRSIA
jgi:hypothetical protein